jgi:hypothetical protein
LIEKQKTTIAAAGVVSDRSPRIEADRDYFRLAETALPSLAVLLLACEADRLGFEPSLTFPTGG